MGEYKILIVDDEPSIVEILKFNLEREGFQTIVAYDAEEAENKALNEDPDLMLLDVMLPKSDGFTVCRRVKEKKDIPIIMLTARQDVVDKIIGLELGADDYISKPYESIREVIARVKANIRKYVKTRDKKTDDGTEFKIKDMTIDTKNYLAKINKKVVDLTIKEFDLLKLLHTKPGSVFKREEILKAVWGYDFYGDLRTVDVAIGRLRDKIEESSKHKYIITKRGIGYYIPAE